MSAPTADRAAVIPGLRYQNAPAAIEWLCAAFGFEANLVAPAGPGLIAHAQLAFGGGIVMLGSVFDDEFGSHVRSLAEFGGKTTHGVYCIVDDADAHYERAIAHGAEVLLPLVDQDYGGRGYSCRDLEGHIWSFGTYDPWADSV